MCARSKNRGVCRLDCSRQCPSHTTQVLQCLHCNAILGDTSTLLRLHEELRLVVLQGAGGAW